MLDEEILLPPHEPSHGLAMNAVILIGSYKRWDQLWRHATLLSWRYLPNAHEAPDFALLQVKRREGVTDTLYIPAPYLRDVRDVLDDIVRVPVSYRLRWPNAEWSGSVPSYLQDVCFDQLVIGEQRVFGSKE